MYFNTYTGWSIFLSLGFRYMRLHILWLFSFFISWHQCVCKVSYFSSCLPFSWDFHCTMRLTLSLFSVCVCVCVCARARACACASVVLLCACVRICPRMLLLHLSPPVSHWTWCSLVLLGWQSSKIWETAPLCVLSAGVTGRCWYGSFPWVTGIWS